MTRVKQQRSAARWRVAWTIVTLVAVESLVCSLSALPIVFLWSWLIPLTTASNLVIRVVIVSAALVPSYIIFALCLMVVSPLVIRLVGWRTPDNAEMRISDLEWPLLIWVRYLAAIHLARVLGGTLFRGSPIWTAHLRLHGARLGPGVYVNSLSVSDYNLLDFGERVVIGASAHVAGHTVEGGVVKTASVRLGRNVTIGLGSVIDIGVEVGPDSQVGALSFVPKHVKLAAGAIYAGVPVSRIR